MIMRLRPWWVDSSPFIYSSSSMFVGLLHFVPVSDKMTHYAKQTISGALAPAMNTNGTALYVDLYKFSYQCHLVQHKLRSLGSQ